MRAEAGEQLDCPASRAAAGLERDLASDRDGCGGAAGGGTAAEAATYAGAGTLSTRRPLDVSRRRASVTGTYVVTGDVLELTMRTCTANPCTPGATTEYGWSRYRDTLTLRGARAKSSSPGSSRSRAVAPAK